MLPTGRGGFPKCLVVVSLVAAQVTRRSPAFLDGGLSSRPVLSWLTLLTPLLSRARSAQTRVAIGFGCGRVVWEAFFFAVSVSLDGASQGHWECGWNQGIKVSLEGRTALPQQTSPVLLAHVPEASMETLLWASQGQVLPVCCLHSSC